MAAFLYRCPHTGLKVQGWVASEPDDSGGETFEPVICTACAQFHLVNVRTGRVLGSTDD